MPDSSANFSSLTASHWSWLAQFRWGHGMIGKLSLVAVVALIVLGVISARIAGNFALFVMAGLATAILFGFVGLILYWAKKNPELAATEGSAYVESQRLGLAAKGLLPPPVLAIGPDPQHPTLLTEAKEVAELDG